MATIAELYGHPLGSPESLGNLPSAACPFMQAVCNGGGNRDMADLSLIQDPGLRARFDRPIIALGKASCAICSVQSGPDGHIICPNRLFYLGSNGTAKHQQTLRLVCEKAGFRPGDQIGYWREVTVSKRDARKRSFNYRLDYVLRKALQGNSYGPPMIVEIMTCSTSGGDRNKGTDIGTAFRKAILANGANSIESPGVNIRQVWARMASQLIVKSQAALAWNGRAFWIIQDTLADYITKNTGLELEKLRTDAPDEVNIIVSTEDPAIAPKFYAGPIGPKGNRPTFSDILKAPFLPTLEDFVSRLRPDPDGSFQV